MEESWKNRKILITGGEGFIGKHLIAALNDLGARTFSFAGDVCNFEEVQRSFENVDIVYHLAAQPLVEMGEESPVETYRTNVLGTLNVLENARKNKVRRIIVASTAHVYGSNSEIPYLETYSPKPSRPYETSKSCADLIAQSYRSFYGLSVLVARFVNTYGPGDLNFSRVVPYVIKKILDRESVEIYGGKSIREYLYIKDAVSAYISLGQFDDYDSCNGIFNFGSGAAINVVDLANDILLVSKTPRIKIVVTEDKRKGEVLEQRVSSEKAFELLGWKPTYTLGEGLLETFTWYRNNFEKLK